VGLVVPPSRAAKNMRATGDEKSGDGETGELGWWFWYRVLSDAGEGKVSGRLCCMSCWTKLW
jgi:hypothetical protein